MFEEVKRNIIMKLARSKSLETLMIFVLVIIGDIIVIFLYNVINVKDHVRDDVDAVGT